jgi:hypothetical protein
MRKQERAAIGRVAGQFSATWEAGKGAPDAWLTLAGGRVAVGVATIKQLRTATAVKPRLRFDKVAVGLVARLQSRLSDAVPDNRTVIVTVTAPIRQGSKTTIALEKTIRETLERRSAHVDIGDSLYGNQICVRVVKARPAGAAKLIGFVHNPDPGADQALLECTKALLECMSASADRIAALKFSGESWLVIVNENNFPTMKTWGQVYAAISARMKFRKILSVYPAGSVETLDMHDRAL